MDVNWPSINAVIIPASASIFLGDFCITNVHTRSTNACYADAKALTTAGKLPFDFIKDNTQLKKTDGYWKLYQARFE